MSFSNIENVLYALDEKIVMKSILRRINRMKAGVYGAGDYGQKLYNIFCQFNFVVDFFIQSDKTENVEIMGKPIMSLKELLDKKEEYLIFIAINNPKVVVEIQESLRNVGYNMSLVFDMRSFISDNERYRNREYAEIGEKECLVCGNQINVFQEYLEPGIKADFFTKNKIVGGGYRKDAICPCCGCLDRTRWVYWVITQQTDMLQRECVVIHFAPEPKLRQILEDNSKCDYYPGDIRKTKGIHKLDVTNIVYGAEMADFIIINHVMEHIKDEEGAVNEMKRVLRKDGKIIMSFPICSTQNTYEDDNIVSEEDRNRFYGQKDHVRLYGTDYKERFERYGLEVQTFSPKDYLTDVEIQKYGLIKDDIVLICSKANV